VFDASMCDGGQLCQSAFPADYFVTDEEYEELCSLSLRPGVTGIACFVLLD
jgi:hypothetical protein